VFTSGLLSAVLVVSTEGFAEGRLTAVPATRLLTDPTARQLLTDAGVEPVAASVELAPLLEGAVTRREQQHSPASLLRADRAVVPFYGREQLRHDLLGWCRNDPAEVSVRLLTGPAGHGKTRLAHHLIHQLTQEEYAAGAAAAWVAGFLRADPPSRLGQPSQLTPLDPLADTAVDATDGTLGSASRPATS
jgi:hypothetical protein